MRQGDQAVIRAVLREAMASAKSQPVTSAITVLMVAGMIFAVMLTTGRTVGAEQEVLGTIDSVGTRTISIRAEGDAGLTSSVVNRVAGIEGFDWAVGFSIAQDATNSAIPGGTKVPVRLMYATHTDLLGIPQDSPVPGELAWASPLALQQLGLPDATGGIVLTSGQNYGVVGQLQVPDYLAEFEPAVFVPRVTQTSDEPISVLLVVASTPEHVTPVTGAVLSVLGVDDASKIKVQTSAQMAQLRALIEGQLGAFSRGLVLALMGLTGILTATLLYGLVMLRRKDFGRRRALGASRSLIVALLMSQTAILSVIGVGIGIALSAVVLVAARDPWPGVSFTAALGILALVTTLLAAVVPAVIASFREPIKELRVP